MYLASSVHNHIRIFVDIRISWHKRLTLMYTIRTMHFTTSGHEHAMLAFKDVEMITGAI